MQNTLDFFSEQSFASKGRRASEELKPGKQLKHLVNQYTQSRADWTESRGTEPHYKNALYRRQETLAQKLDLALSNFEASHQHTKRLGQRPLVSENRVFLDSAQARPLRARLETATGEILNIETQLRTATSEDGRKKLHSQLEEQKQLIKDATNSMGALLRDPEFFREIQEKTWSENEETVLARRRLATFEKTAPLVKSYIGELKKHREADAIRARSLESDFQNAHVKRPPNTNTAIATGGRNEALGLAYFKYSERKDEAISAMDEIGMDFGAIIPFHAKTAIQGFLEARKHLEVEIKAALADKETQEKLSGRPLLTTNDSMRSDAEVHELSAKLKAYRQDIKTIQTNLDRLSTGTMSSLINRREINSLTDQKKECAANIATCTRNLEALWADPSLRARAKKASGQRGTEVEGAESSLAANAPYYARARELSAKLDNDKAVVRLARSHVNGGRSLIQVGW